MKKILALSTALVLAGLSTSAFAVEAGQGYVRVEAGNSDIEIEGASADETAFNVRGGYYFTPNFALEGFYANYGEDSGDGISAKLDGFGVGVVGKKNFGPDNTGFFINGRAGIARITTELSVAGIGSVDDSSNKAYFGIGAGYDFNRNFGLSLNYDINKAEAFDVSIDANTLTAGLEFRF